MGYRPIAIRLTEPIKVNSIKESENGFAFDSLSNTEYIARYLTFKLCSSCPYKKQFWDTLNRIKNISGFV